MNPQLEAKLDGIFVPVFTPFTSDGADINEQQLRHNVQYLIERGIRIINPAGTTGEFWTLSMEEHLRVLSIVAREAHSIDPEVVVVAGVTTANVKATLEVAQAARGYGADLLQIAPPYYLPAPEQDVVSYYKYLSDHVGIPIMVYEMVAATGVRFRCDLIARICDKCRNVIAFKAASLADAMWEFERIVHRFGTRLRIFSAMGAYFSPFTYMTGIAGITDTMANATPEFGLTLHRLARAKRWNEMNEVYRSAFEVLEIEMLYGRAGLKEIANICGLKVGPTRYPMVPNLSPSVREDIERRLAGWEYTNKLLGGAEKQADMAILAEKSR